VLHRKRSVLDFEESKIEKNDDGITKVKHEERASAKEFEE
jgi:hypothetical protein